jgi:ribulose-5-phosphate 4-epimerase/fuculose-1-phosphate aldolase
MVNITETISMLITANHILHYHEVLDAFGHVSVRNPNNNSTFFLSLERPPALVSSVDDIAEYYVENGSAVDPSAGAGYAERFIHSGIYKLYPDIGSVVHSHAEQVLPYTITQVPMEATFHGAGFLGMSYSFRFLRGRQRLTLRKERKSPYLNGTRYTTPHQLATF